MIIIFHLIILATIITTFIYFRYHRFNKKAVIRKLVKNHLKEIKSYLMDNNAKWIALNHTIAPIDLVNQEVFDTVCKKLKSEGFTLEIDRSFGRIVINIK